MTLGRRGRNLLLTAHLAVAVGWIGTVLAYLVLDVTVATSRDPIVLRSAYVAMGRVADWAIVPLAFATLGSGVWIGLGTRWGLFRHYWVVVSLILTVFAVVVLLVEARVIRAYSNVAANPETATSDLLALGNTLPHSVGGLIILLVVLALNIYKPRGLTPYGWRKQHEANAGCNRARTDTAKRT